MLPERKGKGIIPPPGRMSEQGRIAADRLRVALEDKGFISADGLIIPKKVVNETMAGLGYPEDFTVNRALPSILGQAMGGQIEEFSGDRKTSNFYVLTRPKQKK